MKNHQSGFSLIELLIALAVASVLMVSIYGIYEAQVRGAISQETQLDLQQNSRVAFEIMGKEVRMAGCDPTQTAGASLITINPGRFEFTMDIRDDAGQAAADGDTNDPGEHIIYELSNDASNHDGKPDGLPCDLLRRDINAESDPVSPLSIDQEHIVQNIDALSFVYLDKDGVVTADPALVRSVVVSMVARSGQKMRGMTTAYTDNTTYLDHRPSSAGAQQTILAAPHDHFRRLQFTTTLYLRNQHGA